MIFVIEILLLLVLLAVLFLWSKYQELKKEVNILRRKMLAIT